MSQQIIDIGSSAGAGDGDDLRTAFDKVNDNFTEIYSGNVTAANVLVRSVAGRQGNVSLTWLDVTGVASNVDVSQLRLAMAANSAADRAYTDNAVSSLGPISNITITGGNISGVNINTTGSITAGNITVANNQTIGGSLIVDGGLSVDGNFVLGGTITVDAITFSDSTTMSTVVNLAPLNSSVSSLRANVTAANAQIASLQTALDAANANIGTVSTSVTSLQSNAAVQEIEISGLRANITAANAVNSGNTLRVNAANVEIAALRANITAANANLASIYTTLDGRITNEALNVVSLTSNAAVQSVLIAQLQANIAAANATIGSISVPDIDAINANITAANAAIATLQTNAATQATTLNTLTANAASQADALTALTANAAAQATSLNTLTANALAQANALNTLTSNATTQSTELSGLRANITAANSAITALQASDFATNASVIAANNAIQINTNRINAANAQILLRANIASPTFTGTVTTPTLAVTGNATVGNISGTKGTFTQVSGTIVTAAQPNITSIGSLTGLDIDGTLTVDVVEATAIIGPLRTGNQPNITGVGTLGSLTVTGNVASGNVSGTTGAFTNVTGTLQTAAQPNVTSVGTLGTLNVTGNVVAGNVTTGAGNISAFRVTANNGIIGSVLTGTQTNITRVGTLVNLAVTGNTDAGNLNTTGTVVGARLVGAIQTAAQPNITSVGTLDDLDVAGDVVIGGNVSTDSRSVFTIGRLYSNFTISNVVEAANIFGSLTTAAQPNITSVGTLTSLTVNGLTRTQTFVSNATANAVTFYGNNIGATATYTGNINAGNLVATHIQLTGNVDAANVNLAGNLVAGNLAATTGYFRTIKGYLEDALQPNITSVGILSSLTVDGPVEITGSQFVAQDFYVTGNLFVNGNTTTVSAGNVTTSDKDLTLANGAVNSTAARGAGIYIGEGGVYGNISVYDGTWITAQNVIIGGNLTAGNVTGTNGSFTNLVGTLLTNAQPNITSIGTLPSLTVTGAVATANVTASGATLRDLNATNANIGAALDVVGNVTTGNVSGATGVFTNVAGTLLTSAQPNITQIGTLPTLSVTGNVTTGNVSGATGVFTNIQGTVLTAAQPNITTVGNIGNLVVTGTARVGSLELLGGVNSTLSIENLTVAANISAGNINLTGTANLGQISGTILTASQTNITAIGTLATLGVTGNVTTGNVSGATAEFSHVTVTETVSANNGVFTNNVSADYGVFTNVIGTIVNSSQTNITEIGTLSTLTVTGAIATANITANGITVRDFNTTNANIGAALHVVGNVTAGNVGGTYGVFTNVVGTIIDSSQTNITAVGTLGELDVTGNITTTSDVVAGNLVTSGSIFGELATADQPNITSIGTLGNLSVSGTISGNLTATLITGYLTGTYQPNVTQLGTLTSLVTSGNIQAQAIDATNARFTELEGTLLTNAQPYITSVGNLASLTTSGNVSSANVVTGNINASGILNIAGNITTSANVNAVGIYATSALNAPVAIISGNVTGGNLTTAGTTSTGNLTVTGSSALIGNVTVANITISGNPELIGSNIYATSANLQVSSLVAGPVYATTLVLSDTTPATSSNIGALVVAGGIGANSVVIKDYAVVQGNAQFRSNLTVFDNTYLGQNLYFNSGEPDIGIYSNVANVALFPSNTTTIEIGGEATTVNIGAIGAGPYGAGIGNTTIRNDFTVLGNVFLKNGWGEGGIGNVTINNDLTVANSIFANNGINSLSVTTANISASANLRVGSFITVGNGFANARTISTNLNTGALQVLGGAGISGNLVIGATANSNSNVYINSVTATTSNASGALQVLGGISTRGNLWVEGEATIVGNVNFTAFLAASINGTPIGNATPSSAVFTTVALSRVGPAKRPALNIDFANNQRLDPLLSYSRSGPGSYYDQSGNLVLAGAHVPRFTHNPYTLTPTGIMLEESRQNLYRESNSFSNASVYSTLNGSVATVSSATDSPDGNFNAHKIVDDTTTSIHGIYQSGAYVPTVTSGDTYTASAFVKAGEIDQVSLIFFGEGVPTIFDLTTGEIDSEGPGYNSLMTTLANGWYRIQSTVVKTNTSGNVMLALADGGSTTYLGSGSSGAYAYGLQLEPGSFATSYIPNTTTANVRGADTLSLTTSGLARRYNNQENTVLIDAKLEYNPASHIVNNQRSTLVSFSDGTESNRISVIAETKSATSTRTANLVVYTSGILQTNANIATANLTSTTTTSGSKIAVFFKNGLYGTSFNGNGNVIATSANISTSAITQLTIGSGPGTGALNGTISKLQLWPSIVTGDELYALTL